MIRTEGVLVYDGDMVYTGETEYISFVAPYKGKRYKIEIREIGNEAFAMGDFFTRIYRSVDEVFENWSFPKGSKKKYRPGRRISSLDELKSQNVVVVYGKTYDMGWVRGWQFGRVYTLASKGAIRLAVPVRKPADKEEKHDKKDDRR